MHALWQSMFSCYFYSARNGGPLDGFVGGSRIRFASTSDGFEGPCPQNGNEKFLTVVSGKLDDDDKLVGTVITGGDDDILLSSSMGKLIRFHESKVRPMGRTARGVKGVSLKEDMKVISLMIGDANKKILCLSENGYGKQTRLEDFPSYNRGGQGVIALKTSDRNGKMVSAVAVDENDGIMLISDKGTLIRTAVSQIPTLGRNTQGVKVITPKDGEKLIEGVRIPP